MVVKKNQFFLLILLLLYVKPHFYFHSYAVARASDALEILVLVGIIMLNKHYLKIPRSTEKYIFSSIALLLVMLSSLVLALFNSQTIVSQDFVDLIRPFIIVISLLTGIVLSKNNFDVKNYLNFLIILGIIATIVAFLEKFSMPIIYELYSDKNHMSGNRATSIYYDFAEFGAVQSLCFLAALIQYSLTKTKLNIIYACFFFFSVVLSTSKASIILFLIIFILLFFSFLFSKHFFNIKNIVLTTVFGTVILYAAYSYVMYDEALLAGFEAIITLSESNASVGNRVVQRDYVVNEFLKFDLQSFIGHSASRAYEESYIEITFFSILYRYGALGLLFYFLPFIFILFENIKKPVHLFKYSIIAALTLDLMASMTTRFSYPIATFILMGIILNERQQEKKL